MFVKEKIHFMLIQLGILEIEDMDLKQKSKNGKIN